MRFKQHLIGVLLVLAYHLSMAQSGVRPDHFTELTNPTNENFETYSQKNGLPRRVSLNNLRKAVLPQVNPVPVAFFPDESGNLTNLGQFVTDPAGALWYIDGQGNAVNFAMELLEYVEDSIQVSMVDSMIYQTDTLYLFVGDTVFKTEILAGGGSSNWTDLGGIIHPSEGDTVNIPDDFPLGPPGTGKLNLTGRFDPRYPSSGSTSIAIGRNTLRSLTSGIENLALGTDALEQNTTGSWNTAIGLGALGFNESGNNNYAIGIGALLGNISGSGNVAIGSQAMIWNNYGSGNVAIGSNAGENINGSKNVMIGDSAGWYYPYDYRLYIDNSATESPLIFGDFYNDSLRINGYLGFTREAGPAQKLAGLVDKYLTGVEPGAGLEIEAGELNITGVGNDSIYALPDTLCFIIMADTTCVPIDSVIFYEDSVCFWFMGDTMCMDWSSTGINIYNSNGATTGPRIVELGSNYLRFAEGGVNRMQISPNATSPGALLNLNEAYSIQDQAIISISNSASHTHADAFMRYNVTVVPDRVYSNGIDRSLSAFVLSEGNDLSTDPVYRYFGGGDSLVVIKKLKPWGGILDREGDAGNPGDFLSWTGTGLNWTSPSGGAIPINDLLPADGTNTIDNGSYGQEYQWNTLSSGTGLKLSSNSTAAASSTQKLFEASLTGANAISSQNTYSGYFGNAHSGTSATNFGIHASSSGNYANYGVSSSAISGSFINAGVIAFGGSPASGLSGGNFGVIGHTGTSGGTGCLGLASHDSAIPLKAQVYTSTVNSSRTAFQIVSQATSNASPGFGGKMDFAATNRSIFAPIVTNTIESTWQDTTNSSRDSRLRIIGIGNSSSNDIIYFEGDKRTRFNGRVEYQQGADVASVAGAISLGYDGNVFEITGTNAITLISNVGWQNGSEITLLFASTASLTDGTTNSGTDIGFELGGNANFAATAGDVIKLVLSEIGGTQRWREVSRSAN